MTPEDKQMKVVCSWVGLASVAQLVGSSSYTPKVCGLDFWAEHKPRLQVECLYGKQLMFLSL